MDRQLLLKLTDRMERAANFDTYCEPLKFQPRELAILRAVYLDGKPYLHYGERASELRISQNSLAKMIGLSKDTIGKALKFLERTDIDLVRVDRVSEPWAYIVSWPKLANYEPVLPLNPASAGDILAKSWSPPVAPGSPARAVNNREYNPRVNRVPVSYTSAPTGGYHDSAGDGEARGEMSFSQSRPSLPELPWSQVSCAQLVAAVDQLNIPLLRHLYNELLVMSERGVKGWPEKLRDCPDNRLRFLTLCHHAVRIKKLGKVAKSMGVLIAACRDGLNVQRVTHESEEWAQNVLRNSRRDPDLAVRQAELERAESPGGAYA